MDDSPGLALLMIVLLLAVGMIMGAGLGAKIQESDLCYYLAEQVGAKDHRVEVNCELQFEDGIWIEANTYIQHLIELGEK
jgi:hypothetical protein